MSDDLPSPPDGLAQYVIDALQRQDIHKLELVEQYSSELREHLVALQEEPVDPEDIDESENESVIDSEPVTDEDSEWEGWTKVIKTLSCGDDCKTCPNHGPYIYYVRRNESGGHDWEWGGVVDSD